MGGKSGVLHDPKLAAVRKLLEKRFPEGQDDVQGERNFDLLAKQASAVLAQVKGHYHTFLDVLQFKEAALETLRQVSAKVVTFTFDSCPLLAEGFLDLLVGFLQLHVLQAGVQERRLLVALYGCAYRCAHGGQVEPNFSRLAAYTHEFGSQPLRAVQEQLGGLHRTVQEILAGLAPTYQRWCNVASLRAQDVFDPAARPARMGLPATRAVYGELLRGERYRVWVAASLLACPRALGADTKHTATCLGLLRMALADGWVLPVHRGMSLRPHDAFRELLEWFPPKTPANAGLCAKFSQLKLDKLVAELAADAAGKSGARHRQRRVFLCHETAKLLRLVRENPGLLGPKFPAVLAAAAMLRAELSWYFLHVGRSPPKVERGWFSSAPKVEHREQDYEDRVYVPSMIGLLDGLARCALRSARVVRKYHLEYLRTTHRTKLAALVESAAGAASLSGFVKKVLSGAVELLGELPEDKGLDEGWAGRLRAMRCDWLRAEMSIASDVGSKGAIGVTKPLLRRMDLVLRHASFVADGVAGQLKRFASAGGLVFYREAASRMFMESINGTRGQPRDCVAFLRLPHAALDNVHRFCPEEQESFGLQACAWTDWMVGKLMDRFEQALFAVSEQHRRLQQQVAHIEAAYRDERSRDARRAGNRASVSKTPLPGFESKPQYRLSVVKLEAAQRKLQDLCNAIARIGEDGADRQGIVVYNRRYRPQVYLRKRAAVALRSFLLRSTEASSATQHLDPAAKRSSSRGNGDNGGGAVERPTVLLARLRSYIAALQFAAAHVPLDVDILVRQVLLGDGYSAETCGAGTVVAPRAVPNAPRGGGSYVRQLCRWYTDFVLCHVGSPRITGICYSAFRRGFVRVPMLCSRHVVAPVAENWLDRRELVALVTLLGTHGTRMLHGALLDIAVAKAGALKAMLVKHGGVLTGFAAATGAAGRPAKEQGSQDSRSSEIQWRYVTKRAAALSGKDARQIVSHATAIGSALCLRRELHSAARECARTRMPVLQASVAIACLGKRDRFSDREVVPALSAIASDVGIPCSDGALRKALAPLGEPEVWRQLPFLIAATFVSDCWKEADYEVMIDAHHNNAHVIVPALLALLDCFTAGDEGGLRTAHRAFVRCAGATLLSMKRDEKESFQAWPLRAMFVLLEKFVQQSRFLDRAVLENVFPYALLHAAHVDITIGKRHGYEDGMDAARFGRMTSSGTREKRRRDAKARVDSAVLVPAGSPSN